MQSEAQLFREWVPKSLMRRLLLAVFEGCSSAFTQAIARDKDFFLDAIPALRRLSVEPSLSKLVLPQGFVSEVVKTPSTHYTLIYSPKVVITAVTRSERVKWVEPYRYRETFARSRQLPLRFPGVAEPESSDGKLFALLVYGGIHKEEFPTLARIEFPLPCGQFEADGVDLIAEFQDVVRMFKPETGDQRKAQPKLRKVRKSEQG